MCVWLSQGGIGRVLDEREYVRSDGWIDRLVDWCLSSVVVVVVIVIVDVVSWILYL